MRMRSIAARAIAVTAVAVTFAGCGNGSDKSAGHFAAYACANGDEVTKALAAAPKPVRVDGASIANCFARNASGSDIQVLGAVLLPVAQQLGDQARSGDKAAAVQLGYLVGAVQRGGKRNGVAAELVRRIESESHGLTATHAAYERGLRAGLARG